VSKTNPSFLPKAIGSWWEAKSKASVSCCAATSNSVGPAGQLDPIALDHAGQPGPKLVGQARQSNPSFLPKATGPAGQPDPSVLPIVFGLGWQPDPTLLGFVKQRTQRY